MYPFFAFVALAAQLKETFGMEKDEDDAENLEEEVDDLEMASKDEKEGEELFFDLLLSTRVNFLFCPQS